MTDIDGAWTTIRARAGLHDVRSAKRVWLATDCDREGQLIGQGILEHCGYRGEVSRVLFTAQDPQTIREAFDRARPNSEHAGLYAAAVARRQADQIYNLSLTRTATVTLGRGANGVIGVGRVKTPTLAIACKRELEIRDFVPVPYFEVVAAAQVEGGTFRMRHASARRWEPRGRVPASGTGPHIRAGRPGPIARCNGLRRWRTASPAAAPAPPASARSSAVPAPCREAASRLPRPGARRRRCRRGRSRS